MVGEEFVVLEVVVVHDLVLVRLLGVLGRFRVVKYI